MENTVNNVEQFVAVKKMAGVDDRGLVQLELTDGTVIPIDRIYRLGEDIPD